MSFSITGQLVDLHNRRIYPAEIIVKDKRIYTISEIREAPDHFIMPGFIDAHIHIESSMLVPHEFARKALEHGTVATISDPHEIANVLGLEGVQYMIDNARKAKLKFHFGAPSCVPATNFETAGAIIDSSQIRQLLESTDIHYLSEMMNYPGVLHRDPEVMQKIEYAKTIGKPIDGHAPGLKGRDARMYIESGITTDHECFTLDEALDKLKYGMKIIIREGSAAKNYNALHSLIESHPEEVMFCSDDKHPDDLLQGHINEIVKRSLKLEYDLFDVLRIACLHPVSHYNMNVGLLRPGDAADFICVKDLVDFEILSVFMDGDQVVTNGRSDLENLSYEIKNKFEISPRSLEDFKHSPDPIISVIVAIDGSLITEQMEVNSRQDPDGNVVFDHDDILKICVVNRYQEAPVAIGYIHGFGLNEGAIASTVAHDSHNIIAVGYDDGSICRAVNLLIETRGGLSAVSGVDQRHLPLPIAGLMSDKSCEQIGGDYSLIDSFVKSMGCTLRAPFMTLSFMALLVIPKLKMSDLGLFDGEKFDFV